MGRNERYYVLKQRLRALHGDNCPRCGQKMRFGGGGTNSFATLDYETETLLCSCCKSKAELLELVAELQGRVSELEHELERT